MAPHLGRTVGWNLYSDNVSVQQSTGGVYYYGYKNFAISLSMESESYVYKLDSDYAEVLKGSLKIGPCF